MIETTGEGKSAVATPDGKSRKKKKISIEEIKARAGVANKSEKIREVRLRWLGHVGTGEKECRKCSNENMEDRIQQTPKDRKTKTEVE